MDTLQCRPCPVTAWLLRSSDARFWRGDAGDAAAAQPTRTRGQSAVASDRSHRAFDVGKRAHAPVFRVFLYATRAYELPRVERGAQGRAPSRVSPTRNSHCGTFPRSGEQHLPAQRGACDSGFRVSVGRDECGAASRKVGSGNGLRGKCARERGSTAPGT